MSQMEALRHWAEAKSVLTHACPPLGGCPECQASSCSVLADLVLAKDIKPLDRALLNPSYREEEKGSRVRAHSRVSSLGGGVITLAEAELLEGVGPFCSLTSGWVRYARHRSYRAGSCACQTICVAECQETHARPASVRGGETGFR